MSSTTNQRVFMNFSSNSLVFFGTLILIASGSITFLAQSLVAPGGNTSRAILTGWGTGLPLILLAMTVIGALAFIGFLTYYYEDYLHAKYGPENRGEERGRSTYTPFRYSLVLGLGFSAFLFFGLAYLSLVISLAMKIAR
jgi:hypothetical protein